jgi:hypothetical protein
MNIPAEKIQNRLSKIWPVLQIVKSMYWRVVSRNYGVGQFNQWPVHDAKPPSPCK